MKHDTVEELFKKYYNDLLLYALTLTKERASAEDLVSDAFFKALNGAGDNVTDFKPWLFKVCRNSFLSRLRRERRQVELTDDVADEREGVVEKIIKDENYQALYRAIELLPDPQREVVTLFYFEGMKIKDIAEITDKTADYTKVVLYRARESVKKILEV